MLTNLTHGNPDFFQPLDRVPMLIRYGFLYYETTLLLEKSQELVDSNLQNEPQPDTTEIVSYRLEITPAFTTCFSTFFLLTTSGQSWDILTFFPCND